MLGLNTFTIVGVLALIPGCSILGRRCIIRHPCVQYPIEVEKVDGVVLFETGGKTSPLPDVMVAISPYTERSAQPLASTVTRSDGHFSISYAIPGRYLLSVSDKTQNGFSFELRLRPRRTRPSDFLVATIRNDPSKPCGGDSIQLSSALDESCRSR